MRPSVRSPEVDLILAAAGVNGGGGPARPDLDWSLVERVARDQGVLALVARHLRATGWAGVPPGVTASMGAYRRALAARNLMLARRLLDILDVLAEAGIATLPYKGPVLAAYAYGDLGLRPFSDLDIIVAERDVLAARDRLGREGYASLSPRMDASRKGKVPPGHALALRRPGEHLVVEVHWRLAPTCPLSMEHLLADAAPFPLLGRSVSCLSPELTVLVLCVHGGKHAWERLEWICGVAHVIHRQELDWDRLAAEAGAAGARRAVALGLALAAGVGAARVPGEVLRQLGAGRVQGVARQIEAGLGREGGRPAHAFRQYSLALRAGSGAERIRYLLFLNRPSEKDHVALSLPPALAFLYVVVRPLRVVDELTGGVARRRRAHRHGAERAMVRQLAHQQRKARSLDGREEEVVAALALRWRRVQDRLERQGPGSTDPRILEVGSGAHGLVFGSGSATAFGVDPLACDYARLFPGWQGRVPVVAATGDRLPFGDGAFDLVLCDNVIDHAEHPGAIVAELVRMLAPGGLLYFSVNVHHRLYAVAAGAHRAWNGAGVPFEIAPFADHTVHLTPGKARDLFAALPLEVLEERVDKLDPQEQARRRRLRHLGLRLFFKNARFEVVGRRR